MKLKIILSTALFILPLSAYEYNPNAKPTKGILKEPGQKSTGPKKSVGHEETIESYHRLLRSFQIEKNPKIIAKNLSRLLNVIHQQPADIPAEQRAKLPQLFVYYYNEKLKFIPQWDGREDTTIPHQSSSKLHRLKQRVAPTVRFQETIKTTKAALELINQMNKNGEKISLQWWKILAIEGINGVRPLTPLTAAGKKYVAEQQGTKKKGDGDAQTTASSSPPTNKGGFFSKVRSKVSRPK